MCKRSCRYKQYEDDWHKGQDLPCSYCLIRKKTRTAILMQEYGLPSTDPVIIDALKPQNCKFFEPFKGERARVTSNGDLILVPHKSETHTAPRRTSKRGTGGR